jgi:hypothetical protein
MARSALSNGEALKTMWRAKRKHYVKVIMYRMRLPGEDLEGLKRGNQA